MPYLVVEINEHPELVGSVFANKIWIATSAHETGRMSGTVVEVGTDYNQGEE